MAARTVIIESHVPYMEALEGTAGIAVKRLAPEEFTAEAVAEADALIVRTRTRCDAKLLGGSNVSFVGTATIGTDHIDKEWCGEAGIEVASAPGCNAPAVAQYVFASLGRLIDRPVEECAIGIVGVGHVGRIVESWARGLGMRVLVCDPPRQETEGGSGWSSLDEIASEADIITFHTPLTTDGPYPTYHMADEEFFGKLRRKPVIINAARGPVTNTVAWVKAIESGLCGAAAVDCWEGEPRLDARLLELATIATPHIAGYSAAGKMRASQMMADALTRHFGIPAVDIAQGRIPEVPERITLEEAMASYNPQADTAALRANPEGFEQLRNEYKLREEV